MGKLQLRFNALSAERQGTGRKRHVEFMVIEITPRPATFSMAAFTHFSRAWPCTTGAGKANGEMSIMKDILSCPLRYLAQRDICMKIKMLTTQPLWASLVLGARGME